ncbi:MAG: hypothetical protein AAGA30_10600 [Planctomycetota bacterium]
MNLKNILPCAAIILLSCGNLFAQTDFFWSVDNLNSGATNSDASIDLEPGESGTLYLYYTTNGPADSDIGTGAFVDVMTSASNVIEFTGAETLDFEILLFGSPTGFRWSDLVGVAADVESDFVNELGAATIISGIGILEDHNGSGFVVDEGYDSGADAFLFGKIDFTVIDDAALAGTSIDIMTTSGSGLIINGGQLVPASFGLATINVVEGIVMGDLTGDGIVNVCDVPDFVQAIIGTDYVEIADMNQDGIVDLLDIRPFVKAITPL